MTCRKCKHEGVKKFGYRGKSRIQRYRCQSCNATFSEPQPHPLGTMRIPMDIACRALQCLLEGCSIRSTERLTGVNRNTIMALLLWAGERCEALMRRKLHSVTAQRIQADEIWTYVAKKEKHTTLEDGETIGDQYVFVGMDADTKLVISWIVGKRSIANTHAFMRELYGRLAWGSHPQLTTDGWGPYVDAVDRTLGHDGVDFAQLIKVYGLPSESERRYSPPRFVEAVSKPIFGNPDPEHISTSYIERQNLTMRMQMRRFTRLTNAFSKRLRHLKAAIALHFAYYDFCRVHSSLRVTPAMEAGIADHVWSLEEIALGGD